MDKIKVKNMIIKISKGMFRLCNNKLEETYDELKNVLGNDEDIYNFLVENEKEIIESFTNDFYSFSYNDSKRLEHFLISALKVYEKKKIITDTDVLYSVNSGKQKRERKSHKKKNKFQELVEREE